MGRSRVILSVVGFLGAVAAVALFVWRAFPVAPLPASGSAHGVSLAGRETVVYKSPFCGCCSEYEDYLRRHGLSVVSVVATDLTTYKPKGLAPEYWSCHTAVIGNYFFVEGHVPVKVIAKLLQESPDVSGVTLPGMPAGSPGMAGEKAGPWTIYALSDGKVIPFMTI